MSPREQMLIESQRLKGVWFDIEMEQRRLNVLRQQVEDQLNKLASDVAAIDAQAPVVGGSSEPAPEVPKTKK